MKGLNTIFITNNHARFHTCRKKKLVKWLIKINGALRVNQIFFCKKPNNHVQKNKTK